MILAVNDAVPAAPGLPVLAVVEAIILQEAGSVAVGVGFEGGGPAREQAQGVVGGGVGGRPCKAVTCPR
ncbi:hypothetical protein GCM10018965_020000 [Nonomuraea roseola]